MIPVSVSLIFFAAVFGLFWYIFRGFTARDNPVWGNILAATLNGVICIFLVYWLFTGNICDTNLVKNATYEVNYNGMADATITNIVESMASHQYILDKSGAGMYTISTINPPSGIGVYLPNFIVGYSTYDLIYVQYQDKGLAVFFIFLTAVNIGLFLWFLHDAGQPDTPPGGSPEGGS
jgi:hypothetical protein